MQIRPSTPDSVTSSLTAASTVAPDGTVSVSYCSDPKTNEVLVTVSPPSGPKSSEKNPGHRAPLDICCVIDISGSMGTEAPIRADPATGAPSESTGLSVLDVVKHSIRTIVSTMQPDDRIALVTFSDTAKTVFKFTKMNQAAKDDIHKVIEGLRPDDCTNLWDGLKMGMTLLYDDFTTSASKDASGRLSTLFILTDGMPNIIPPRGHSAMLKSFLEAHPMTRPFCISTFGFGYSLDSQLLLELAQIGGGTYGFIPDAGMVGTVFIHAVANIYSTYAPRARLDIELPEGSLAVVKGGLPVIKTSWGIQIDAGDIQFGQSREYVVVSDSHAHIAVTLTYRPFDASEDVKVEGDRSSASDLASLKYHAARLDLVDAVFAIPQLNDLPKSLQALEALRDRISGTPVLVDHSDASSLVKDISGEGLLALEPNNFRRWGRHYLPSLARAHQRQQCGNFKDPGLQVYGCNSAVFLAERDKLDAAFDALPPPKPSVSVYVPPAPTPFGGVGVPMSKSKSKKGLGSFVPKISSMSAYRSSSGPCFAGECLVKVPGDAQVKVEQLKRGMEIETLVGPRKVAAIIRTTVPTGEALLCQVGGLRITPWHPIISSDKWVFPADVTSPDVMPCDEVYSVLLWPHTPPCGGDVDKGPDAHTISIGGIWCVTLGHGITSSTNGDIRAHAFLGDYEKILRDISLLDGFHDRDGVVRCIGTKRGGVDHCIYGFIGEEDTHGEGVLGRRRNSVVSYV